MWTEPGTWPASNSDGLADVDDERAPPAPPAASWRARAGRRRAPRPASTGPAGPRARPRSPPSTWPTIESKPIRMRLARRGRRGRPGRRRAGRSADRRRPPSRATSRTTSRPGSTASPGRAAAACASADRASTTSAPAPERRVELVAGQRLDHRAPSPPSSGGPGLVDRPHPGEVARDGRLAGEQRPGEGVDLHRAEQRVVAPLVADRRPRGRRDPRRAQRPGAVGRVDHDRVLVAEEHVVERAVHRRGERRGVLRAEQVGPPDRADQQRAAGQQQERLVGPGRVGDRVADVLRRVAGRVERPEADRADVERVAVARPAGARGASSRAGADDVASRRSAPRARDRPTRSRCGGASRRRG